jgi:crotonobetainyl-CoA:carnitine CoA-transferase CaiB-like acyl-CoA transferase
VFASRTLDEWRAAFATLAGAWAPVQRAPELRRDPQVVANGYVQVVTDQAGHSFDLVGAPAQFDGQAHSLRPAPEHGEHTDEVLLDLGYTWDELVEHKVAGTIT